MGTSGLGCRGTGHGGGRNKVVEHAAGEELAGGPHGMAQENGRVAGARSFLQPLPFVAAVRLPSRSSLWRKEASKLRGICGTNADNAENHSQVVH